MGKSEEWLLTDKRVGWGWGVGVIWPANFTYIYVGYFFQFKGPFGVLSDF